MDHHYDDNGVRFTTVFGISTQDNVVEKPVLAYRTTQSNTLKNLESINRHPIHASSDEKISRQLELEQHMPVFLISVGG
jgi:hypothetical protein